MRIKFFLSIVLINFRSNFGQSLNCTYSGSTAYTCSLTIQNPNGFNNFTSIGGTHLTGKTDNDVQYISSSGSTTNVPSIICDTFPNLLKIEFGSNGIQIIDEKAFKNCTKLKNLWLQSNRISKIDENAFVENVDLLFITFNVNQITEVAENLFINQHKLTELRLCSIPLSDLPKNIFNSLQNLTILHLESNILKDLRAEWFLPLTSLLTIYLSSNLIEELPKDIFIPMKNLNTLYLGNNKLKVIPSDPFKGVSNLKTIQFQNNQIEAIDEMFINNTGVQNLNMLNNICANQDIVDTSIPRTAMRSALQNCFKKFNDLYPDHNNTIDCTFMQTEYGYTCRASIYNPSGFNGFTTIRGVHHPGFNDSNVKAIIAMTTVSPNIPRIFCDKLSNVETIYYIQLSIKNVGPNSFWSCSKLLDLNIWVNQIQDIDNSTFFYSQQLKRLDMRQSRISNIPRNLLWPLTEMTSLNLEQNNLTILDPDWFLKQSNLTYLNLQFNKIEELPKEVFKNMTALEQLVMNYNRLGVIHSNSFGIHSMLTNASFVNNQIYAIDERFIDNTGLINIDMRGNICANTNIFDNSPNRDSMRAELKNCFQKYADLYLETTTSTTTQSTTSVPQCNVGDLDDRVCFLELENHRLQKRIEALESKIDEL
ncbi:unnamed protein product [Chironomus riparius]|uniref:Uncharacterized protein n=1 Tax=Chironomus riparius TaxID=315576 RepID=A0A9N9RKB4_9DIPT|nr:unnamed protein product [Chironomus riparius]